MRLLVCEGIQVNESQDAEDISGKSIVEDVEASGSKYVFSRQGNGFKRYDTIGGRRSESFEPFVKADGFGSSDLSVASSNYGFHYPTEYKFGNIGKATIIHTFASGTFDVQSSLRHLGGQDSGLSNIGGFDYDGHDGIHVKGSFTRHYGLPRHTGHREILKNKLGYRSPNIGPISSLRENNLKKLRGLEPSIDNVVTLGPNYGGVAPRIAADKSNYAFGDLSSYEDEEEAETGENLAEGYEVVEDFDKDEKEAVEKSHQFGYQEDIGGSKKGEEEENAKYRKNESAVKGLSGENYGKNESHKKGHKTSGFHNIYHKDEYKKDTSFYDNEHVDGHEEKYGSENSQHEEAEGGQENVQKLDADYHENEHAQKEVFLNGHQYGSAQGHDREASGKEHYAENTAFSKKNEQKAAKANGSLYLKNYN
ncbi:hypothetical protein KPH14_005853 [Odynerus spinipes]|uniref:Uncharacterized protein n=1 Tax=Odynerus spinipes TaxID=1348599 RepID=A0AAD9RCJ5_9HYME|nr:hypothetical protein KPH14_005853 [Odynerus spinipes]